MNSIQHNDPELENLLIILAEHPDEKENLIPRILKKLPWGCHPILYIEKIKDPQNRILIRDSITFELQIEKIKDDLVHLLPEYKSPDFLLKASFLMSYLSGEDPAVYDEFEEFLNTLSSDFKERLDLMRESSEAVKIKAYLNYFFNELNFHGSQDTAGNIDHHNIQKVVNSKEGSAIILCILANRIAAGAGINLPIVITAGHFLLRTNIENEIPFIDPFENGKIISEKEHMYNVASKGYDPSIGLLHITSPLILLQRLLRNIAQSMNRLPNQNVNPQIKELQEIIKSFIKDNP